MSLNENKEVVTPEVVDSEEIQEEVVNPEEIQASLVPTADEPTEVVDEKSKAEQKLDKEIALLKINKMMAHPIKDYLVKQFVENEILVKRVLFDIKTLDKCLRYVIDFARSKANGESSVMLHDDVVYDKVEEYYLSDNLTIDKPVSTTPPPVKAESKPKTPEPKGKPKDKLEAKKTPKEVVLEPRKYTEDTKKEAPLTLFSGL